jgi:sulfur carrier protein
VTALTLLVNGEEVALPAGSTLADVVASLIAAPEPRGIAVALDRTVIPRSAWSTTVVRAGASVEVVTAAAGG